MRDVRLGDDIDDYCVRCKRVMNHAVVSVINNVAAKVRCRTCHSDHDFRHEQQPPPKVDARKAALFQEVLKTVDPEAAETVLVEGAEPEETGSEAVPEAASEAASEATAGADAPAAKPAAKTATKTAPKGKAKAKK
jgi:hypothetical protein